MKRVLCSILLAIMSFACGVVFIIYQCGYILESERKRADKFFSYFKLLDRWLTCKEQNYSFEDYFIKNNIKTAAIYGMGQIGKHLKYELETAGIEVSYVIDEGESVIYGKERHYNLRDDLPLVDIVIVTPVNEFEEIKNNILDKNRILNVVSVNSVIRAD